MKLKKSIPEYEKKLHHEKTFVKEFNENLDLKNMLLLFKKYAPYSLEHEKAEVLFINLQYYLTDDEIHKLYVAWEELHLLNKTDSFHGYISDLLRKYS